MDFYTYLRKQLHKSEKETMEIINNFWTDKAQYYSDIYHQAMIEEGEDE